MANDNLEEMKTIERSAKGADYCVVVNGVLIPRNKLEKYLDLLLEEGVTVFDTSLNEEKIDQNQKEIAYQEEQIQDQQKEIANQEEKIQEQQEELAKKETKKIKKLKIFKNVIALAGGYLLVRTFLNNKLKSKPKVKTLTLKG